MNLYTIFAIGMIACGVLLAATTSPANVGFARAKRQCLIFGPILLAASLLFMVLTPLRLLVCVQPLVVHISPGRTKTLLK